MAVKCCAYNLNLIKDIHMDGWMDGWIDMNIYNAQFLQPRQSRVCVHGQQLTDESWVCCRIESVLVLNLQVMVVRYSRAEEHMKWNCAVRRWQFLLPELANRAAERRWRRLTLAVTGMHSCSTYCGEELIFFSFTVELTWTRHCHCIWCYDFLLE